MITKPSVPFFLLNNHKELNALEVTKSQGTEDRHGSFANAINKDKSRQTKSILLMFPEGMVCTTDMSSMEPRIPSGDLDCNLEVREMSVDDEIEGSEVGQIFYPAFWELSVLDEVVELVEVVNQKPRSLHNAFQGMKKPKP